ncbi:MAG: SAM-dependent methyltransferase [Mycobacterium sp.]|jgi:cyclopropane-fatty-acyl-phospholipid synthase|nr:SAM-dependent methyltransferase [Mycobacterium sp.]
MTAQLNPRFAEVQAHYDMSDEFFRLFLDTTQTYSCAYFERDDMTLEDAQLAKIDLSLGKLGLQPGMTLLDVGCGWGATMKRSVEQYDVNVIGLTLSQNQADHVGAMFDAMDTRRSRRVLLAGWGEFDEPVDRIVSIGAFEHFGPDRYQAFFKIAYRVLPADGVLLLHTISRLTCKERMARGLALTRELVEFSRFILAEIFPEGRLPRRAPSSAAAALRADAGHVGSSIAGQQGPGCCGAIAGGLRTLHALPDWVREAVPRRSRRRHPVHPRQVDRDTVLSRRRRTRWGVTWNLFSPQRPPDR